MSGPQVTIVVGDQNLTACIKSASWSNVDPGGFEACQISLASPVKAPRAGERITIRYGLEVAWQGRVNDPGNASADHAQVEAISGVGYGAALKDQTMRATYVHANPRDWNNVLSDPAIVPSASGWSQEGVVTQDTAITLGYEDGKVLASGAQVGVYLDLQGVETPDRLSFDALSSNNNNTAAGPYFEVITTDDMTAETSTDSQQALTTIGAGPVSQTITLSGTRRYVIVKLQAQAGVTISGECWIKLTGLRVFRSSSYVSAHQSVLAPTTVAHDALTTYNAQAGVQRIDLGPVDVDANAYAVPHAAYLDETPHEQIIDDMVRNQLGWHWGVWEPAGVHSDTPRLFLTKPPETATAHISRRELGEDFDAPRVRLDQLYDAAKVTYTDASGRPGVVTVTITNPLLSQAGVGSRTLVVNAGQSTSAAASTYGTFALNLALTAARGAGSATLPADVGTPAGRKPACLLRAGRDRLRITDLPDPGPAHESDTRRYDTFHVRRVETSVGSDGVPKTRVELGSGADLMEVLNARTAAATVGLT